MFAGISPGTTLSAPGSIGNFFYLVSIRPKLSVVFVFHILIYPFFKHCHDSYIHNLEREQKLEHSHSILFVFSFLVYYFWSLSFPSKTSSSMFFYPCCCVDFYASWWCFVAEFIYPCAYFLSGLCFCFFVYLLWGFASGAVFSGHLSMTVE